ncbi:YdbL family protein [Blastomonas sp.]|uniref:YdbL family protein n=1 Tax=Blastomonas sp. TaxID=1909299 RepID=UPI00391DEA54
MTKGYLKTGMAALLTLGLAMPAMAQRDPAYEAARAAGTVGEKPDGYLAVVSGGDGQLQRLVSDINLKRKQVYTDRASAEGSTVEQFAFTAGCNTISRTKPGEKYMAPDGSWKTRDSSPPVRDARCP